jgi:hypothetical protein
MQTTGKALFDEGARLQRVWAVFRLVGYKVAVPTWQLALSVAEELDSLQVKIDL